MLLIIDFSLNSHLKSLFRNWPKSKTSFQFSKKNNRETGPALVGIELVKKEGIKEIYTKMNDRKYQYEYLNQNSLLFNQLIG